MFQSISKRLSGIPYCAMVLFSFFLSCSKDDDDPVSQENLFINEIYAASGDDWIELYNAGDELRDIGGYTIYDESGSKYKLPSGTSIVARGFLLIFCDGTATGLHTNFELAATGETVTLENVAGKKIDQVQFMMLGDGQSYGRFPDGSSTLGMSGTSTQGIANGDNQSAVIAKVFHSPVVPGLSDAVTVKAEVISNSGINSVDLFYRVNGGAFTSQAMNISAGFYQATIPALNATGLVEYYVSVKNLFGTTTLHPFDAPQTTHRYLLNNDPLPALRINEFMASNTSCCPDTDGGVSEFDDWIEIYNAGNTPVNVAGMYVSDDKSDPFKSRIPDTDPQKTTVQPGAFLLLWADEDGSQGVLHLKFKLGSSGEDIGLFYIDGRTIDSYSFGAQLENKSSGLTQDGGMAWQVFAVPTPGASND